MCPSTQDFGYSFFVLVAVATYVANLAAFLTRSMLSNSLTTMDGIVSANKKICAHPVLKKELQNMFPTAVSFEEQFHPFIHLVQDSGSATHFSLLLQNVYFHMEGNEYRGILDD